MDPKKLHSDVSALLEETEKMRGLGDVVAKATKRLGIKPCTPCEERRRLLNRLVPFKRQP